MSLEPNGAQEDHDTDAPPRWFANVDEDTEEAGPGLRRWLIGLGVFIVVLIMLLIPVLQAGVLQRNRDALPDEETQRTAFQFASAMLFARSAGQALLFAEDAAAEDVRRTLDVVAERPEPSRLARLQVIQAPCSRGEADHCYQGRILDPGELRAPAIRFGIDETDDGPRVVWVELDELTVRQQRPKRPRIRTNVGAARAGRDVPFDEHKAGVFGHLRTPTGMAQ